MSEKEFDGAKYVVGCFVWIVAIGAGLAVAVAMIRLALR